MRRTVSALLCCLGLVGLLVLSGTRGAGAEESHYVSFGVADNQILCALSSDGSSGWVRCDVYGGTLSPFERPASCDSDFGRFFTVNQTGAGFASCESDMAYDPRIATELPAGEEIDIAPFLCRAEAEGVTCTNADGQGFTATTAGQTVF